jgi:DNA polymerase
LGAKIVALHASPQRWSLLYRLLWRLTHDEPHLLENPADADSLKFTRWEKDVRRDEHHVHAFVRFREVLTPGGSWFVAYIEPAHDTLVLAAPHFVDRFHQMRWSILSPKRSVHWDGKELRLSPGVARSEAPAEDAVEPLWIAYYSSIFNPARLNPKLMQAHLPRRAWRDLPEAAVISQLVHQAAPRVGSMLKKSNAKKISDKDFGLAPVPASRALSGLRKAAESCRACPLWKRGTQVVFGEGPRSARVVFVGEQPGDAEDLAGKPFVGPAGKVLDRALEAAGIVRSEHYFTNAVKHFKWEQKGKRRMHEKPSEREVAACQPWLMAELEAIKPKLIVCLGATAARSVLGQPTKVLANRGKFFPRGDIQALVTIHPSMLLRLPPDADRDEAFGQFVADLKHVSAFLKKAA